MSIIYVDVLVVVNIYIGYFLLSATKKILSQHIAKSRLIAGCIAAGLSSLTILLQMNLIELFFLRLLLSVTICFIVFFDKKFKLFIKSILSFYLVNFLFGGVMYAINAFISPGLLQYKNGVCYIDINLLTLTIYTIIAYLAVSLLDYLLKRRSYKKEINQVRLQLNGREALLTALYDTGNKLVDVLTGLPVLVCELKALEGFLPTRLYYYLYTKGGVACDDLSLCKGIRVIPINVVSGESSLMAFKPQAVVVADKPCNMLVAVTNSKLSDGSYNAIISAV